MTYNIFVTGIMAKFICNKIKTRFVNRQEDHIHVSISLVQPIAGK